MNCFVREHLKHVDEKLNKRGYRFCPSQYFEVLIDMLEERGLLTELASVNCKVGVDGLRKKLAGPLSQEKVARYIADKYKPSELEFVLLSGFRQCSGLLSEDMSYLVLCKTLWVARH